MQAQAGKSGLSCGDAAIHSDSELKQEENAEITTRKLQLKLSSFT